MTDSTSESHCPSCGAEIAGGQGACQALFDEIGARAYRDVRLASVQQLVVDAYCLQHPEPYCHSAKSYAAHLSRLCIGLEHGGNPETYAAIPRWLNGEVPLERPEPPSFRGQLTIADVAAARDAEGQKRVALEWAREVWRAYASQHDLARNWIAQALAARGAKKPQPKRR